MANKGATGMSGSEAESSAEVELEEGTKGARMNSDSEEESIQVIKKRAKKMIIEDVSDNNEEQDVTAGDQEREENANANDPGVRNDTEGPGSVTVSSDDSDDGSDSGTNSQFQVKLNSDLYDAEESSEGEDDGHELDLDGAAGHAYDSAEDKDFDESTMDPKLLKKLKKLKGASKKPREQKSRKCKPTKDEMLDLWSESQRLIRETHVSLPYHKPAPKSLQDFLQRSRKKKEVYKDLKGALDIEKAKVIQEKIAEPSIVKLPRLRRPTKALQRSGTLSPTPDTQPSLPDSGHVSSSGELHSQGDNPSGKDALISGEAAADVIGDGDLRGLTLSESRGTMKGEAIHSSSQCSVLVSDGDHTLVEEIDSPPPSAEDSQSQCIEDVESLSLVECDSQRSQVVASSLPALESDDAMDTCTETDEKNVGGFKDTGNIIEAGNERTRLRAISPFWDLADAAASHSERDQACEDVTSNKDSDPSHKAANTSSQVAVTSGETGRGHEVPMRATDDVEERPVVSVQAACRKAVAELAQQGVVPALRRPSGNVIILDEEVAGGSVKGHSRARGMQRLMERLVKQNKKREPQSPKDVHISIVEKIGEEGKDKGLKLTTVTYRMTEEEDIDLQLETSSHTPGGQLQILKHKLQQGMRKRRAAAFERRKQLYALENEEGFVADDGLPEDEEEAEMTDQSDTDNEGHDVGEDEEKRKDWNNPFFDEEAEEDYEENEDLVTQRPVCAEISDAGDDDDLFQDNDQLNLQLDMSDAEDEGDEEVGVEEEEEENHEADKEDKEIGLRKSQGSKRLMLSDEEEDSQEKIPSAQDATKTYDPSNAGEPRCLDLSFESMTPMTRLLQDTQPRSNSHRSSLTQPIEDSQDLYEGSESDHNNSFASSGLQTSFNLDAVSQMLDADGYIKIPSSQPQGVMKSSSFLIEGSQDVAGGMEELMGLCSGHFAGIPGSEKGVPVSEGFGGLFDQSSQSQDDRGSTASLFDSSSQGQSVSTQDNQAAADGMDDLLGLCSGQFMSSNGNKQSSPSQSQSQSHGKKRGVKRRLMVRDDSSDSSDNEGDGKGTGPFKLMSDYEVSKDSEMNELSGSDNEKEDGDDSEAEQELSFKTFKTKGKLLQQFVEDEAELSGSEAESDEDLDLAEEDDILEMEAGEDDVTMNEDQLRDQVGRVHMKQILDDDDRELMRYKEMYLPDGDLHSEGAGRHRRFHWKNLGDEGSQQDIFADRSDEEKEGTEDPDEKQWRMQRFEREQFLESQQQEVAGEEEEKSNSQLIKFGKFFMKKQVSEPSGITGQDKQPALLRPKPMRSQSLVEKPSPGKFVKPKIPKRGSFLARSKENLARIAEITKSSALNVNGSRGSRNFVFSIQSADNANEEESDKSVFQLLTKGSTETNSVPAVKKRTAHKPPTKKQCIEPKPQPQSQKSIFRLIDK